MRAKVNANTSRYYNANVTQTHKRSPSLKQCIHMCIRAHASALAL